MLEGSADGYLAGVAILSREEFDAIEFDAAYTGDHRAAAQRMSALAATGVATESMPRAEAFVRAGEQWLLADDPRSAAGQFRMAIADGGPSDIDPRVPMCRALFLLDDAEQARADPRACTMLAETLFEHDDLNGALEWATAGIELILQGGGRPACGEPASYAGLDDLLRLRYRIRNDLRLPEDEYDRMMGD